MTNLDGRMIGGRRESRDRGGRCQLHGYLRTNPNPPHPPLPYPYILKVRRKWRSLLFSPTNLTEKIVNGNNKILRQEWVNYGISV